MWESISHQTITAWPLTLINGSIAKGGGEGRLLSSGKKQHKKRRRKPEAGVVLKVYVENFMCHRKLTVPLCK